MYVLYYTVYIIFRNLSACGHNETPLPAPHSWDERVRMSCRHPHEIYVSHGEIPELNAGFMGKTWKHNEAQWSTMKHNETQWNTMKHNEAQWNTMKHNETLWNTMKHNETLWNTMKHNETSNTMTYRHVLMEDGTKHEQDPNIPWIPLLLPGVQQRYKPFKWGVNHGHTEQSRLQGQKVPEPSFVPLLCVLFHRWLSRRLSCQSPAMVFQEHTCAKSRHTQFQPPSINKPSTTGFHMVSSSQALMSPSAIWKNSASSSFLAGNW